MDLAKVRAVFSACLLTTVVSAAAFAQNVPQPSIDAFEPAAEYKLDKILHAYRLVGAPPRIDGLPNDEAWSQAQAVEGLVQRDPDNGGR